MPMNVGITQFDVFIISNSEDISGARVSQVLKYFTLFDCLQLSNSVYSTAVK